MSKSLNQINPRVDDLTKINDKGIKILYQRLRQNIFRQVCTCGCGKRSQFFTKDEVKNANEIANIVHKELTKRGHIPNSIERRFIRQTKAKTKR